MIFKKYSGLPPPPNNNTHRHHHPTLTRNGTLTHIMILHPYIIYIPRRRNRELMSSLVVNGGMKARGNWSIFCHRQVVVSVYVFMHACMHECMHVFAWMDCPCCGCTLFPSLFWQDYTIISIVSFCYTIPSHCSSTHTHAHIHTHTYFHFKLFRRRFPLLLSYSLTG
jgi:hypothetical protein